MIYEEGRLQHNEIAPRWQGSDAGSVRSIWVTVGNGGLGLGIACYFLNHDPEARVWQEVRANRGLAENLAVEYARRCRLIDLEVTDPAACKTALGQILEADGRLDVLVNNAGMHCDSPLAAMPDEVWHSVSAGVFSNHDEFT